MFKYVRSLVEKIKSSEKGQGMVEYALIIAFVAGIAILVLNPDDEDSLYGIINNAFGNAGEAVNQSSEQLQEGMGN